MSFTHGTITKHPDRSKYEQVGTYLGNPHHHLSWRSYDFYLVHGNGDSMTWTYHKNEEQRWRFCYACEHSHRKAYFETTLGLASRICLPCAEELATKVTELDKKRDNKPNSCLQCEGAGILVNVSGDRFAEPTKPCPTCNGTGEEE